MSAPTGEHVAVTLPMYHRLMCRELAALDLGGRPMGLESLRRHADHNPTFPAPINLAAGDKATRQYRLTELRRWMATSTEVAAA